MHRAREFSCFLVWHRPMGTYVGCYNSPKGVVSGLGEIRSGCVSGTGRVGAFQTFASALGWFWCCFLFFSPAWDWPKVFLQKTRPVLWHFS